MSTPNSPAPTVCTCGVGDTSKAAHNIDCPKRPPSKRGGRRTGALVWTGKHIRTWLNYDIVLERTPHPCRPELETYYNAELNLWLIALSQSRVSWGRESWTFYTENNGWASGDTPEAAFERLLNTLQGDISGPYIDPVRAQQAAELIADLEDSRGL